MSCIQAAKEPKAGGGTYATNEPLLCITLATLGFKMRCNLPIAIVFDAQRIIQMIDRETGEVDKLAYIEHVFEFEAHTVEFGKLIAPQVYWAYELAKQAQKRDRGDFSGAIDHKIKVAQDKCHLMKVSVVLATTIKFLYDMVTNWNVYTAVVKELADNPFLKYQRMLSKGIASVAHPLESESTTFKRHEKLFRGMSN